MMEREVDKSTPNPPGFVMHGEWISLEREEVGLSPRQPFHSLQVSFARLAGATILVQSLHYDGNSSSRTIRTSSTSCATWSGSYVDPPARAIVLSLDEKSQIQALDRTQPGLPLKKGRLGTMTHDYKRHGTTLFASLNVLDGTVIGRNMQRHRHQEFMRFLNAIEAEVPAGKMVHVILDNYAAHKHPKVRAWLDRHERFVFHFTPTSCSWLNAVEGFFARLSRRRLKRGVFRSVVDLQAAINRFLAETNAEPSPSHGPQTPTKSSPPSDAARRKIDDQTSDHSLTVGLQFGCHHFDVQTGYETRLRIEVIERALDETHEVAPQDEFIFGLREFHVGRVALEFCGRLGYIRGSRRHMDFDDSFDDARHRHLILLDLLLPIEPSRPLDRIHRDGFHSGRLEWP